ncbi:MAG: hypothetical protein QOH63_1971 [Acidobacteriota bacterium]|jgi:hypothetical protein|nr:hypothetical protein [Acidobacteriota bacterium]
MKKNANVTKQLESLMKDARSGKLQGFVLVGVEVPKTAKGEAEVSKIRYTIAGSVDTATDLVLAGLEKLAFEIKNVEMSRDPILK